MSTTAGALQAIPQYHPDLFVNREKEIELVTRKAQSLSLGELVRERTIVFWGYKGTGRTWLLKRLEEVLSDLHGVRTQYIDLGRWHGQAPPQAVKEITKHIASQVAAWLGRQATGFGLSDSTLVERSNWPEADIKELLSQHILVLLLDHVYESDWALLEPLEEHILASVAVQPRALLVMAGRGRAYPWKTPELRLYVKDHYPKPFDEGLTAQQLERQRPDAVSRTPTIHEMSQGYPLGNYLLAARPTVVEALKETVDSLLEGVPSEERSWLEGLCIPQAFDEERIPVLLAVYLNDPSIPKWSYREVRQTRDRLLRTALVRWKEEVGGWEVDEAIRPVLERYLQQTKPETWRRLHCAAYRLYKDWEQQYPEEQERWQQEANHHAQCLRDAGHDPDRCS